MTEREELIARTKTHAFRLREYANWSGPVAPWQPGTWNDIADDLEALTAALDSPANGGREELPSVSYLDDGTLLLRWDAAAGRAFSLYLKPGVRGCAVFTDLASAAPCTITFDAEREGQLDEAMGKAQAFLGPPAPVEGARDPDEYDFAPEIAARTCATCAHCKIDRRPPRNGFPEIVIAHCAWMQSNRLPAKVPWWMKRLHSVHLDTPRTKAGCPAHTPLGLAVARALEEEK